ncbi:folate-binding protein [Lysinibacter sp. HNR]|uniref:CAF17-like 4Fe-4S cluster assembly/insertion protein YgfZ n=1 Tax=Lysinibacter sp. HNR TaxID=3031408 RepID=UPI00243554D9|nr:folate-binding protein [Lysinibacter sp. HNR]WGD38120.1 folate-binding protein [Lysinibacter sp. HNR]
MSVESQSSQSGHATAMRSPFFTLPRAIADGEAAIDQSGNLPAAVQTPAHYGSPNREQRELVAGRALVDLGDRGVVTVTGEDRLAWLHNMTTQSLLGIKPGDSAETMILGPTGRIEHVIHLYDDGDTSWLIVEGDQTVPMVEFLNSMRFMMRVEVADVTPKFTVVAALYAFDVNEKNSGGAAVDYLLSRAETTNARPVVWRDAWNAPPTGGWQYARFPEGEDPHPSIHWRYVEAVVPRGGITDVVADLTEAGLSAAGWHALEALRVEAWRPRQGHETDERAIPHEYDWMRTAVHLSKGCYRGQETVAKVHNLGHPPRRLVMLHLDGTESILPRRRDPVYLVSDDGRKQVGVITTAARHYELGGIALALLKRSAPIDTDLLVIAGDAESPSEIAAAQNVIVPPDAGSVADVPRLPRLNNRAVDK